MPNKTTAPLFVVYGGDDLEGRAYRALERCPAHLDDFLSYDRLGRQYVPRKHFQATGVSMYTSFESAAAAAKRFRLGWAIATLELTSDVMWTRSSRHGHITVWAPAPILLGQVLQCVEISHVD